MQLIDEAVAAGARCAKACEILHLDLRTTQRWRRQGLHRGDGRCGPRTEPGNKLSNAERRRILDVCNSPDYRDLSPKQIVPILADKGIYIGSESTLYRVLRVAKQLASRGKAKAPQRRPKAEHIATGVNQVWSWDITYLRTEIPGEFYYLYMVVDVWSRKVITWTIQRSEDGEFASEMLERAIKDNCDGAALVVHSDNGAPMKSGTLLATLQALGIIQSFSRPRVSDDNPYSEALFRTVKYRPEYPAGGRFKSIEAAREWTTWFVGWYNTEHRHSGIEYVTPEQRHSGDHRVILERRTQVYEKARTRNPHRWTRGTRDWTPTEEVRLNPLDDRKKKKEAAA